MVEDEWDAVVVIGLKNWKEEFRTPKPDSVWKNIVKLVGDEQEVQAIIPNFEENLVDHQRADLVKMEN